MTLRTVAVVGLLAAVTLSASATAGFGSAHTERDIRVNVVADEDASLGLEWSSLNRCGKQDLVEISNRFTSPLTDIDVSSVHADRLRVDIGSVPDELTVGESDTIDIRLSPEQPNRTDDRSVTVRVEASGPSVTMTAHERHRPVTNCPTRRENAKSNGGGGGNESANASGGSG